MSINKVKGKIIVILIVGLIVFLAIYNNTLYKKSGIEKAEFKRIKKDAKDI